jgi:2-hydroxychromene-2-carboxylate isomerase
LLTARGIRSFGDAQQAVERGVFGAPTFFIDGQMHWGQDRLDFVKEALKRQPTSLPTSKPA